MTPEAWIQLVGTGIVVIGILWRIATMATKFEAFGKVQAGEIKELKDEVKEIAKVVTQMAVQTTRLDAMAQRISMIEKLIDDLRRGEGYIYPLVRPKPPQDR